MSIHHPDDTTKDTVKSSGMSRGRPWRRPLTVTALALAIVLVAALVLSQPAAGQENEGPASGEAPVTQEQVKAAEAEMLRLFMQMAGKMEEPGAEDEVAQLQEAIDQASEEFERLQKAYARQTSAASEPTAAADAGAQPSVAEDLQQRLSQSEEALAELAQKLAVTEADAPDGPEAQRLRQELDKAIAEHEALLRGAAEPAVRGEEQPEELKVAVPSPPVAPATRVETPQAVRVTEVDAAEAVLVTDACDVAASYGPPSPNDIVHIKMEDNLLDLPLLLEAIGRELQLTFLYDKPDRIVGKFRLEPFGELRRRDLLPLLESLLSFNKLAMVKQDDGPFIRIVPMKDAPKVRLPLAEVDGMPALVPGETVVTRIVKIEHAAFADVQTLLGNFIETTSLVPIPNTKYVIFTESARRMPRLLEIVELIDQPGPDKDLTPITIEHANAEEIVEPLKALINDLTEQGVIVSGAPAIPPPAADPKGDPKAAAEARRRAAKERAAAARGQTQQPQQEVGPIIHVHAATNRLFVIGTEEQTELVKKLLVLLDVEELVDEIRLMSMQVEHVYADDVTMQLEQLIEALTQREQEDARGGSRTVRQAPQAQGQPRQPRQQGQPQRAPQAQVTTLYDHGVFLIADERTNRLFVVGTEKQIELVVELLALLDVEPYDAVQPVIRVYRPEYVEASEALDIMDTLGITQSDRYGSQYGRQSRDRGRYDTQRGRQQDVRRQPQLQRQQGQQFRQDQMQGVGSLPTSDEYEVRVAVQEATNRMLVLATLPQHEDIVEIMRHIDIEPNETEGDIKTYSVENVEPGEVASVLKEILDAERTEGGGGEGEATIIPGLDDAPTIVALDEIWRVAVRGTPKQHREIERMINEIDRRQPQVLLEAILVQVTTEDTLRLGVTLQDVGAHGDRSVSGVSPFSIAGLARSTGGTITGTGGVLAFFDDDLVYAALEALETVGDTRIMSKPRVTVTNHQEGIIDSNREEPTTKQSIQPGSDTPVITFDKYVEAGTKLTITPHISDEDFVVLEIDLAVDSFDGEGVGSIPPPRSNNSITTQVNVPDGMTIVLGGLTTRSDSVTKNKVPLLGDIPLLGALFQNVTRGEQEAVLYVFVRAQIIRSLGENINFEDLDEASELWRRKLRESEKEYNTKDMIPGLNEKDREDVPSALDH